MLQYTLHPCNIAHSCNMQQYVESQQPTSPLQHTPLLRIILPRHAVFILNHFRMHPHQYMLHQHMLSYAMLCLFNIHQAQITTKKRINYQKNNWKQLLYGQTSYSGHALHKSSTTCTIYFIPYHCNIGLQHPPSLQKPDKPYSQCTTHLQYFLSLQIVQTILTLQLRHKTIKPY